MTKPNTTRLACIIDESGSMGPVQDATIKAINGFLLEQKQVTTDTATVSFTLFSSNVKIGEPHSLAEAAELSTETYRPRGGTALNDAIGMTLNAMGAELAALAEDQRPADVIVVIQTDGQENGSRSFTRDQVREMIKHQQEVYNWRFIFLGANIDVDLVAGSLGISAATSLSYSHDPAGMRMSVGAMSKNVSNYRSTKNTADLNFDASDKLNNDAADVQAAKLGHINPVGTVSGRNSFANKVDVVPDLIAMVDMRSPSNN